MLPANTRGAGMNICFPDVCVTPPGVPVPYVNIAPHATAATFAFRTFFNCLNALNLGSLIPMTMGDQAGTMSPFMGPGMTTMGNPKIFIEALPASSLLCPATGNNMIAGLGATLVAGITNVLLSYAAPASGPAQGGRVSGQLDPGTLADLARAARLDHGVSAVLVEEVALVHVPLFSCGIGARLHDVVRRLGPRALVIDLRGCAGGDLRAAVDLASDFLPEGAVVATLTDEDGDDTVLRSWNERPSALPLVVLVDRGTASAAEVFAGSLQGHGRALVAGERTYGKGTVQQVFPAGEGGGARCVSVATVTLPGGRGFDGVGIEPDLALSSGS